MFYWRLSLNIIYLALKTPFISYTTYIVYVDIKKGEQNGNKENNYF